MPFQMVAMCKSCGKPFIVRESVGGARSIEIPNPSRISKSECPHCHVTHDYRDRDLKQIDLPSHQTEGS
jgi:hypothetical protein